MDLLAYGPPWGANVSDVKCDSSRVQLVCTGQPEVCPGGATCTPVAGPFGPDGLCTTATKCDFCALPSASICAKDELCNDALSVCVKAIDS